MLPHDAAGYLDYLRQNGAPVHSSDQGLPSVVCGLSIISLGQGIQDVQALPYHDATIFHRQEPPRNPNQPTGSHPPGQPPALNDLQSYILGNEQQHCFPDNQRHNAV